MKIANPHRLHNFSARRQLGQAVLWFMTTLAACCATLALVYNVGQVTNEKEKTVNAADAAALSGGLAEARTLNFVAYTNRAMIADEVTVAQLVSTESWVSYDATMATYLDDYLQPLGFIPYVGEVIVTALDYYADIMGEIQSGVNDAVPYAIKGLDIEMTILSDARKVALTAGLPAADSVANSIAAANMTTGAGRYDESPELNPAFTAAFLALNLEDWIKFTDDGSDRQYAAQVIQNARDQFSTSRGAGPLIDGLNDALKYGLLVASGGWAYVGVDKTSTETKLKDYDHWAAQDSLDLYAANLDLCGFSFCYDKNYIPDVPLAYGKADADKNGDAGDNTGKDLCQPHYSTAFGLPPTNCSLAGANGQGIKTNGIPQIADLTNPGTATSSPSLTFVAGVQKPGKAALTTQDLGGGMNDVHVNGPLGSPDLANNLQNGDKLTSISAAKVFFARPSDTADKTAKSLFRADGKTEYASLYNPYWQARLAPVDSTSREAIYAAIGASILLITPDL